MKIKRVIFLIVVLFVSANYSVSRAEPFCSVLQLGQKLGDSPLYSFKCDAENDQCHIFPNRGFWNKDADVICQKFGFITVKVSYNAPQVQKKSQKRSKDEFVSVWRAKNFKETDKYITEIQYYIYATSSRYAKNVKERIKDQLRKRNVVFSGDTGSYSKDDSVLIVKLFSFIKSVVRREIAVGFKLLSADDFKLNGSTSE